VRPVGAEAEAQGTEGYPLYAWTKATIEDPVKKAKHIMSFAIHVKDQAVYTREEADALEADLAAHGGWHTHHTFAASRHEPPVTRSRRNAFASLKGDPLGLSLARPVCQKGRAAINELLTMPETCRIRP